MDIDVAASEVARRLMNDGHLEGQGCPPKSPTACPHPGQCKRCWRLYFKNRIRRVLYELNREERRNGPNHS